jgi:plastocyanin
MNSKIIIVIVVVLLIVGGGYYAWHKQTEMQSNTATQHMNMQPSQAQNSATSGTKPTGKNAVTIQNFAFSPANITIKAGQSITWTNEDSVGHSATADDNSWDTGVLSQGQSKSVTFAKAGKYTYHCSVHPNMKATVVVQ